MQLQLYDRCPRRFLYSHVLGAGGLRTPTTLSRMHDVVQRVVDDISDLDPDAVPPEVAQAILKARWDEGPLAEDIYAPHFGVASRIVDRYVASRSETQRLQVGPFTADTGDGRIGAQPTEVLARAGGGSVARIVRTGHAAKSSGEKPADAAFAMAIQSALPGCEVEMLHLADDTPGKTVSFGAASTAKHLNAVTAAIDNIAAGSFVPKRSERTCPSCPTLFICGPVAEGALQK